MSNTIHWHKYPDEKPLVVEGMKRFLVIKQATKGRAGTKLKPFVTTAFCTTEGFQKYSFVSNADVIAWAELPPPYQEEAS